MKLQANVWLLLCLSFLIAHSGCSTFKKLKNPLADRQSQADWESDIDTFDPLQRRPSNKLMLADLGPGQIAATIKSRTRTKSDQAKAEQEFNKGREVYAQATAGLANKDAQAKKLFTEAANHFRLASSYAPDSVIDQDALYYQGESYFFADAYTQANRAYELLLSRFSGTRYLDRVESRRFAIAQYWLKLDDEKSSFSTGIKVGDAKRPTSGLVGEARRILHRIRLDDPTGKLADDATLALANSYFKSKKWAEASETYEDLRMSYPGSRHQFHAHLFELKARLENYQGGNYDGQPLEKANKLLTALMRQFPTQMKEQEEYLRNEGGRIRKMMAERDLSMARYYEKRGENRAAAIYYEQVAKNFADTPLAEQANARVAELATKDPVPKPKAAWLNKVFPDASAVKPLIAAGDNETIFK